MINIIGFEFKEEIYSGTDSIVFKAIDERDRKPVVIKLLKSEYPTPEELNIFQSEFNIAKSLESVDGIVQNYQIVDYHNTKAIILEDFGGISLDKIIREKKLDIKNFLYIAIKCAEILEEIHKQKIIHKDIKPHNILINIKTGQIKIIDFGIATRLTKEIQSIVNPDGLEGTIYYISPEQTGRMNRSIDYRTDLYSLGVSLYQMITGRVPFQSDDPMEIVHSHMARLPESPSAIDAGIPSSISNIILKLMEKTAEKRYMSAFSLKRDLNKCYTMFKDSGVIDDFPIGENDISDRFQIPEKIYGRDNEIAHLLDVFEKVSGGSKELVFFSGQSGIGKTVIINEVHKPIVEKRGYFIGGKYDQFKRNIPYTSIIQAFTELAKEIITESDEKLVKWKFEILKAIGNNGSVITEIIPSMEMVIGKQPEVQELPPAEAQNRFNMVFQNFIRVFATEKHPLVLFLDDLQWADSASLKLLDVLLSDIELNYLLFLGAYRDNEVDKSHPFIITLDNLKEEGLTWEDIHLKPLIVNDISDILCDTLYKNKEDVFKLSEMIVSKTGGNPFFVTEFLKTLYSEKLINFKEGWQWDFDKIQKAGMTNNIIELMADKIKKLPIITLDVLKAACCSGVKFYLDTVATVCNKSESETYNNLEVAINEGMIFCDDSEFRFVHDKVREATYSLISETEQKEYHYRIGKNLLKRFSEKESKDIIFAVVNQLNLAIDLLATSEKEQLLDLNCKAGEKAKASTAYESSVDFLRFAEKLLPEKSWKTDYTRTLLINSELSEVEYLARNYEAAEKLFDIVLKNARDLIDKSRIYTIKIDYLSTQGKKPEAINEGRKALRQFRINVPKNPGMVSTLKELIRAKILLGKTPLEELINLPEMTDEAKKVIMTIFMKIAIPAYMVQPNLFPVLIMKMVNMSLKYGISSVAPTCFSLYGVILASTFNQYDKGYKLSQFSLQIMDKFNTLYSKGITLFTHSWLEHWVDSLAKMNEYIEKMIQACFESGDLQFYGYGYSGYGFILLLMGKPLNEITEWYEKYTNPILKLKQPANEAYYFIGKQFCNLLQKDDFNKCMIKGEYFDEDSILDELLDRNDETALIYYYFFKTMMFYFTDDIDKALISSEKCEAVLGGMLGQPAPPVAYFLNSLVYLKQYKKSRNKSLLKKILKVQKMLEKWKEVGPKTYLHKYNLISAELAVINNDNKLAMKLYDQAIISAKESFIIQEEAMANECAANFYLEKKMIKIAAVYMKEARYCYLKWGAMAKVEQLDDEYSDLLASVGSSQLVGVGDDSGLATTRRSKSASSSSSGSGHSGSLDLATVMKASNAISGEIEMKKLLSSMINILIENAGAQKGALILFVEDHLFIEAEADIDSKEIKVLQSIPLEKGMDLSPAIVRYVAKTKESIVLDNASEDTSYSSDSYIQEKKPLSILCTPIINQGRLAAVLYLENNLASGVFTPERVEILKVLSSQAAISIENARLIENLSEQERLKKEMEIAERIQTSLCPPSPDHGEFEIAAAMQPAEEVGGDYYDIVEDATGSLWFAIGDVSGHGVTPGLIMMMAETAFGSNVEDSQGIMPSEIIKRMNRILCKNIKDRLKESHFMTMNLLKHLGDGRFVHSGAHLDIIVYRAETKRCELFETGGLFLGMIPDISHAAENSEFKMERGDILIVYTDGVTEAADSDGKLLDPDGLCAIIEKNVDKGINGLCSAIVSETLDWCNHKQADDITLIVAKRK